MSARATFESEETPDTLLAGAEHRGRLLLLAGTLVQAALTALVVLALGGLTARGLGPLDEVPIIALTGLVLDVLLGSIAMFMASTQQYGTAENLALALGILGFPLGFGVVGLIFVWAYVNLGRAQQLRETSGPPGIGGPFVPPAARLGMPGGPLASNPVPPPNPTMAAMPPPPVHAPNCPRCRVATSWVAQYSRYFCGRCRQYV